MRAIAHLLVACLPLTLAVAPCAAQETFKIPPAYELSKQEEVPEKPAEEGPKELVYGGEPLVLPLQCRAQDFLRAGQVCGEDEPCHLFLELNGMRRVGSSIVATGNVHTSASTIASVVLLSADDGKTWREPAERIGAASLESVYFVDQKHGWITGEQQNQDDSTTPFLLVTPDGGETWVRQEIWAGDEDRSGAILEIHFDSPQHGYLIVDRLAAEEDSYELYESMNGGMAWMIRQISPERPEPRRPASRDEPDDWRLREDTETETYDIERLQDGAWATVARFAVPMGACQGMEATVPFHVEKGP